MDGTAHVTRFLLNGLIQLYLQVHEIEAACDTCLLECEETKSLRRRVLSTRMLLRLVDRHHQAKRHVEASRRNPDQTWATSINLHVQPSIS